CERALSTINVGQLEDQLDNFLKNGTARKVGKKIEIDLTSAGFDKLLGSGKISSPLVIKVKQATDRAASKVAAQGGELVLTEEKEKNTVEAE
ncbi:MAG: uL15 family ribosomal protein, partial [Thermoplasmata archaeon]